MALRQVRKGSEVVMASNPSLAHSETAAQFFRAKQSRAFPCNVPIVDQTSADGCGLNPRKIVEIFGASRSKVGGTLVSIIVEHLLSQNSGNRYTSCNLAVVDLNGKFDFGLLECSLLAKYKGDSHAVHKALAQVYVYRCRSTMELALCMQRIQQEAVAGKFGLVIIDSIDSLFFCDKVSETNSALSMCTEVSRVLARSTELCAHCTVIVRQELFAESRTPCSTSYGKDYRSLVGGVASV